jgi:hypothetical protein
VSATMTSDRTTGESSNRMKQAQRRISSRAMTAEPFHKRSDHRIARAMVLNTGPRVEPAALLHKITELSSYPVPFDEGG